MKKVLLYSALLIAGLIGSQALPAIAPGVAAALATPIKLATMFCLAFIMIHVGWEFDIDKTNPRKYAWDYVVAATAAAFPWIFVAGYFIFVMSPSDVWGTFDAWKQSLLVSRFSAPTSAGVLFSMLAAAGLASTWVFKKARVLAIFDDLDTILLMIPLKIMIVGFKPQLAGVVVVIAVLLWLAWAYLHRWKAPTGWKWMFGYAAALTLVCEAVYLASVMIDEVAPVHLEVLLPAFVLGCVLARPAGEHAHDPAEEKASTGVTAAFMVLVGLSMPAISTGASSASTVVGGAWPGWGMIAVHVFAVTVLANLGKMFCVFCYRNEATFRERLAVSVGMFPRGEVGAGILVVSLSYGIGGPAVTVAMLSLALNLLCTGLFIAVVKKLIARVPSREAGVLES